MPSDRAKRIIEELTEPGSARDAWDVIEALAPKLRGPWCWYEERRGTEPKPYEESRFNRPRFALVEHESWPIVIDEKDGEKAWDDDRAYYPTRTVREARAAADTALRSQGYRLVKGSDDAER